MAQVPGNQIVAVNSDQVSTQPPGGRVSTALCTVALPVLAQEIGPHCCIFLVDVLFDRVVTALYGPSATIMVKLSMSKSKLKWMNIAAQRGGVIVGLLGSLIGVQLKRIMVWAERRWGALNVDAAGLLLLVLAVAGLLSAPPRR